MSNLPLDREGLIEALRKETVDRRRSAKWLYRIVGASTAFIVLAEIYLAFVKHKSPDIAGILPVLLLTGFGIGVNSRHKAVAQAVSQWRDPAVAPMLAEALNCHDQEVIEPIKDALRGTLPFVNSELSPMFEPQAMKQLVGLARDSSDADLAEVTLRALGRIGTLDELGPLQAIADGQFLEKNQAVKDRLSTEARMAMSEIRLRAAKEIITERLGASFNELEIQEERLPDVLT